MIFRGRKKWPKLVWIIKRQVINYFILYHLLLSFKFEKLYDLRQKKRDFLHTIYMYDINVKTKAQITCAVIAELIHSFLIE